jgi:hypothetical protein
MIFICLGLFSIAQASAAQSSADCPAIAKQALEDVANNCAIPTRNSICYGFPGVTALDVLDEPIASFSEPGDRTDLLNLQELRTTPLNVAEAEWGIAVTNIQANLPIGMPGQGGVFISMGDVRLENGVEVNEALVLPESALALTASLATEIYSAPPNFGISQEVIGATANGATFQADGISPDGEWVRVFFTSETTLGMAATGWVAVSAFPQDVDLTSLPTITPVSLTPMQKFYLSNGIEVAPCVEAPPPMLYVQGPEEIELDFIVNDASIRVSSTALIRIVPPGNIMQVIALSGIVILDPNGSEPVILLPGFFSVIPLEGPFDLGVDGQANDMTIRDSALWSPAALMNPNELEALAVALNGNIAENLQYYGVDVPILICASGVGEPICVVQQFVSSTRIAELCALGLLPPSLCGASG